MQGRTAILVDDGIATGTTARAALRALKRRWPANIVYAGGAARRGRRDRLLRRAIAVLRDRAPSHQVEDTEVIAALEAARPPPRSTPSDVLHRRGPGTPMFDLLDEDEAADRAKVFDIDLLAGGRFAAQLNLSASWSSRSPV